jgi:hypothetical protein
MFILTTLVFIADLWGAIEGLNRAEKGKNRTPLQIIAWGNEYL